MRQINKPGLDDSQTKQDTTQPVTLPEMLPTVPDDPAALPEFEDESLAFGPTVRDSRPVQSVKRGVPLTRNYARPNVVPKQKDKDIQNSDDATPVDPRVSIPHSAPSTVEGDEVETKDSSDFTPFDPRFSTG